MATGIFTHEYWLMVAEEAKRAASQPESTEPSPEEVKRALLDDADRWSPEARHWLGI
jgi:hypothetical protein